MFQRSLELNVSHTASIYHLGLMQHKNGELKDAMESFSKVLSLSGDSRDVYESRGLVFQDMKSHQNAIADFNSAVQLEPDQPEVYYYRGTSKVAIQQYDAAIEDFHK